jgi:hypothetical protein
MTVIRITPISKKKIRQKVRKVTEIGMNSPISSIRCLTMDPVIDLRTAQPSGMLAREVDRR